MKEILTNIAKLIDVKSIMSLIAVSIFAYLSLTKVLPSENVMQVILLVLTFYFAKNTTNNKGE